MEFTTRTILLAIIAAICALAFSSGGMDLARWPALRSLRLQPRQDDGVPAQAPLYDPDNCTPKGISYSPGDCGLVERYLQVGGIALFKRNQLAMGNKNDSDGNSCSAQFWEPGTEGACCNYAPREVTNNVQPDIRIDCNSDNRVTGVSWGIPQGTLASHTWLYMPFLEYLRIYGIHEAGTSVNGPFPNWILRHTSLKYLFVEDTMLEGEIKDLSDLYQLQTLHINNNQFTGSIPMLPASLQALSLVNNKFSGVVATDSFPANLQYCALSNNNFCFIGEDLVCGPRDEMAAETGTPYGVPSCKDFKPATYSSASKSTSTVTQTTKTTTLSSSVATHTTEKVEAHVETVSKTTSGAQGLLEWSAAVVALVGGAWIAFAL